jgi:hypothetical protein
MSLITPAAAGPQAPTYTPSAIVGRRFGYFEILARDATGKRLAARCVCDRTFTLSAEAVALGIITSCGCRPPTLQNRAAFREEQARQARWASER